jgi:F-type H+-transporting ATPase subunit delta
VSLKLPPSDNPLRKLYPTVLDPVQAPLARVYAEALYEAADKQGMAAEIVEEYQSFLKDVLGRFPKLERLLLAAAISPRRKDELIRRLFESTASRLLLNFLRLLNRRARLDLLRAVGEELIAVHERKRKLVRVDVEMAVEPDPALRQELEGVLGRVVDGTPKVRIVVEPAIVGGVVLRIGDRLYDASVRLQLQRLRRRLQERSRYEIQSRRDQLYLGEGNSPV